MHQSASSPEYDVAVIGGGPGGSTAAILLAQAGRRVVLIERDAFPRFKIGESLLPYSMAAFDRLGIKPWLEQHAFPKHGGEIATACGERAVKFYFKDGFQLAHRSAYQVERATFDAALLERARAAGAEIRQPVRVESAEVATDGVTLSLSNGETLRARYVVDAGGRQSVVGRGHSQKIEYPGLKKFSVYAHYTGVQREPGIDAGLTRLVRAEKHWFWMIPLDEERTSVGVVMDLADFRAGGLSPEETLQKAYADSPVMTARMAGARQAIPVQAVGDYSYRQQQLTGSRWMLAGDAAGFIDPIFSTGVFLAIHSGEQCADALNVILDKPGKQRGLFARYERRMHQVMDMYLRFVSAWYRPEFIEVFTTPVQRFQLAPAINAVLAGNIGGSWPIWWRMQVFYLVLFLQRYATLCPRLASRTGARPTAMPTSNTAPAEASTVH